MKNIAVIDVGSNSVRLMFVADGKVLYKALETTRLGEGIAALGLLSAPAIERTANAVAAFYQKARNEGAQTVRAFATAAVRSSKNGGEFLKSVAARCPLQVEVISGEEEAKLGILGAIGSADGAMIDIGGASTELTVQKNGAVVYAKSVNVGAVRLKDLCGRDWEALQNYCENAVKEFEKIPQGVQFYAIGGTATTLASLFLRQKTYDGAAVTGTKISAKQMQNIAEALAKVSVETLIENSCVPPKRADILLCGAVWLTTLMKTLGIEKIVVSDSDNLEGYARSRGLL